MDEHLYIERIQEALRLAEGAHHGQTRKGTDDVPYILHPMSVAMILASTGADEDLLVAALLHDVAEDTSVGVADIEGSFGARVATIVEQVTKPSGEESSAAGVAERLQSEGAVLVKAADLIVNLGDVVLDAKEQGPEHLTELFSEPAAKLRSYLQLAKLLIERLGSQAALRGRLIELSIAGEELLSSIDA